MSLSYEVSQVVALATEVPKGHARRLPRRMPWWLQCLLNGWQETGRVHAQGLFWAFLSSLHQVLCLLPWLFCLMILRSGFEMSSTQAQILQTQESSLFGLGTLLLMFCTVAAYLRSSQPASRGGDESEVGPLLALVALLLWHLGFQRHHREEIPWCLAILKGIGSKPASVPSERHVAFGLVLLDDMIRTVLHFVSGTPAEAWPFALTNKDTFSLWSKDEEWWAACYQGSNWQKLPVNPHFLRHGQHSLPEPFQSSRRLFREAWMLASMMAETFGMLVILEPPVATTWAAIPCIASTMLVVSCAPWLPRQSELVLIELCRLISLVSRFIVYFQVSLLLIGFTSSHSFGSVSLPEGLLHWTVEATALVVLYGLVLSRLWAVMARCRAASPLYAVQAEDVIQDPLPRTSSAPLYCGSLGRVEGAYAPTLLCTWEELASNACNQLLTARERFTLRHCGELLVAREAHLLSHLDALSVRIEEAEKDEKEASSSSQNSSHPANVLTLMGLVATVLCIVATKHQTSHVLELLQSRVARHAKSSAVREEATGCLGRCEILLWAFLLLRICSGWYQIVLRKLRKTFDEEQPVSEAVELREQALKLHNNLAETQWMITRFEDRVQSLGISTHRQRRPLGMCTNQVNRFSIWDSSFVALAIAWIISCLAIAKHAWPS